MTFQDVHWKCHQFHSGLKPLVWYVHNSKLLAIMGQSGYSAAFICEGKTKKAPAFSLFWISFWVKTYCRQNSEDEKNHSWLNSITPEQDQTMRPHEGVSHQHQHCRGSWELGAPSNHHHPSLEWSDIAPATQKKVHPSDPLSIESGVFCKALFWSCIH